MSMNVIDIASYQATLDLSNVNYDGVAIKATEGVSYINPYCDHHYQQARSGGKKRAVYHFYDFSSDAVAQADYFVNNCMGYIRDAIFVLDWEGSGVADVGQALTFLRQVEARTGVKPAIYMSEWVENTYDWSAVVANDNGLWIAKYSNWELQNHAYDWDTSNAGKAPNTVHWPFYFMWQWTSTGLLSGYAANLDCDIAYLSGDQWDAYAGVPAPTTTTTTTTAAPTTTSTTTVAPAVVEPQSPDAPTTTVQPAQPVYENTTTTTTVAPVGATTSPATQAAEYQTWGQWFAALFIAIIKRLQGKRQ